MSLAREGFPPGTVVRVTSGKNLLYYGDNLDVLREHIADESVDLVYLDPPFNSNATYNVLFASRTASEPRRRSRRSRTPGTWSQEAEQALPGDGAAGAATGRRRDARRCATFLGENDMMAYLAMMAPRLVELRRVLKPTGSLYLHCDPTASHYLKMLMDAVFGPTSFRNEIIWKRTSAHSDARSAIGRSTTSILYYAQGQTPTFGTSLPEPITKQEYLDQVLQVRRRRWTALLARRPLQRPDYAQGSNGRAWRGVRPGREGRCTGSSRSRAGRA